MFVPRPDRYVVRRCGVAERGAGNRESGGRGDIASETCAAARRDARTFRAPILSPVRRGIGGRATDYKTGHRGAKYGITM